MEIFKKNKMKISVRNLVEFILKSGDIDNRRSGKKDRDSMAEGRRLHKKIQDRMGISYKAEVPLKIEIQYDDFIIGVEGRADGINTSQEGEVTIDEIKCMYGDIHKVNEPSLVHKAQAMCYGYIYGIQNEIEKMNIRLTYVNIESEDIRYFDYKYSLKELTEWFYEIMGKYYKWADYSFNHINERNASASSIQFPFEYRKGQRDIVVSTYKVITMKKDLFIQAPTGVGKTMSVIFPGVKAVGEEKINKIFYLTAKTITRTVAVESFKKLREQGLVFKTICITAKDKICPMEERECNPEYCHRAKGHLDRINDCIYDIIKNEDEITREKIESYGEKHRVCPFELSLDVSEFCDCVICDYNYAFDPVAKLKRYFVDNVKDDHIFLVDEAHNLVDRGREMYSASISKEKILHTKKFFIDKSKRITGLLEKCNKIMLGRKRELNNREYMIMDSIDDLAYDMSRLYGYMEKFFEERSEISIPDEVLEFYFELSHFLSMYDYIDFGYEITSRISRDDEYVIYLMCIDPSRHLKECFEKAVSTILFSATLLPVNYYKTLLTGDVDDYAIYIDSPFEKENRIICISSDVSTKYTRRGEKEYRKIAEYINYVVMAKKGNYMVFFPSYKFMEDIFLEYKKIKNEKVDVIFQASGMNEIEREEFLGEFAKIREKSMVAFCVMGGIFSEGIDLTEEKLIGAIVVGTGFPQVSMEREIIKKYFDDKGSNGFDYAYKYPGINKVLQSAGRVIRTINDIGVIMLLDARFKESGFKGLFPREWDDIKNIDLSKVKTTIEYFWEKKR